MQAQKIIISLLTIAGIIATFLPWATGSNFVTQTGNSGPGWITLFIYAIILFVLYTGRPAKKLSLFSLIGIIVLAILNSVYAWQVFKDLRESGIESFKAGIGIQLVMANGILIPIAGIILGMNYSTSSVDKIPGEGQAKKIPPDKDGNEHLN